LNRRYGREINGYGVDGRRRLHERIEPQRGMTSACSGENGQAIRRATAGALGENSDHA
jgi:hypothetical protein